MSWFTKYRPAKISELHLESVKNQLQKLMKGGTFPQALLFTGPRGTGKTSSARIVGAMLNDPQNEQVIDYLLFSKDKPKKVELVDADTSSELAQQIRAGSSYTVNEMDAASNRGIDDIRLLREKIMLPPQQGKVSVYILDEVHMLTTEAFNALLKVLEEPPHHVVFVLATTEFHKVPETIVSRCSVVRFSKASTEEITTALSQVLQGEKIEFEPQALDMIAQNADGSFRDAVKLLEMVVEPGKKLTKDQVVAANIFVSKTRIQQLITALLDKDELQITQIFSELRNHQVNEKFFYKSLLEYLHQQLLYSIDPSRKDACASTKILHYLLQALTESDVTLDAPIALLSLELKFLEMIFKSKEKNGSGTQPKRVKKNPKKPETVRSAETEKIVSSTPVVSVEQNQNLDGDGNMLISNWNQFMEQLHQKNISLELLLKSARPVEGMPGKAIIEVYYSFHKEQLQQPKFLNVLQECVRPLSGGAVNLEFVVADRQVESDQANIAAVVDDGLVEMAKEVLV